MAADRKIKKPVKLPEDFDGKQPLKEYLMHFVVYCTGKRTSRKLAEKEVFCRHPEMLSEIVVFGSWQPC